MDNFFDNLCRSLASPMPRKRALKVIAGGFAGAILAPFVFGQSQGNGQGDQGNTSKKCRNSCVCPGANAEGGCCSPGQTCWGTGSTQVCCGAGYVGALVVKANKTQITCIQVDASRNYPSNTKILSRGSTCS